MKDIIQAENTILRQVASEVPLKEIGSAKLQKIIKEMSEALDACEDGVAIAAPQIGVALRIFVVSGKILPPGGSKLSANQVYINPIIKKLSTRKVKMEEGCLSVRNIYGITKRADSVMIEAINENGFKFARRGSGLLAQIFQHEMDHLDGVLFIDKATNLEEILPEEIETKGKKSKL